MKTFLISFLLCAALLGCEQSPQQKSAQPKPAEKKNPYTKDYLGAVAVADEFCYAWKHRNITTARRLMGKGMIRRYPDVRLHAAIVGQENPRHAGFELSNGRSSRDGRYEFDVKLFFHYVGEMYERIESPKETIIVARSDEGFWVVEDFPVP